MSSLSQEDLDAGWDDVDVAARQATLVEANTIPPSSMIRKKQEVALASLVASSSERVRKQPVVRDAAAMPTDAHERHRKPAELDGEQPIAASEAGNPAENAPDDRAEQRIGEPEPTPADLRQSSRATRHRSRWLVLGALAVVSLGSAYLIVRHNRHAQVTARATLPTRVTEGVRTAKLAPVVRDPVEKAVGQVTVVAAPAVVQGPASASGQLGESFSDAFVKHAASINSNWADAKKRNRVAETQSASRPKPGVNASGENPLDVLDQLEKVRKAKKASATQP